MYCPGCQLPFDSASGICPFCAPERKLADRPLARKARSAHDTLAHCSTCGQGVLPGIPHTCTPVFDTSKADLKH